MRLLALCLLPVLAQAAPIYKSTDANGHVTYSADAPAPQSGDQVEMLTPDPSPRENKVHEATARERQLEDAAQKVDQQLEQRRSQRAEREAKLREAEAALAKAKQAYTDGQTPQDGERVGTLRRGAEGKAIRGSRLTEDYHKRIKQLEEAVKTAEAAAIAARKQLRDSPP